MIYHITKYNFINFFIDASREATDSKDGDTQSPRGRASTICSAYQDEDEDGKPHYGKKL